LKANNLRGNLQFCDADEFSHNRQDSITGEYSKSILGPSCLQPRENNNLTYNSHSTAQE